VAPGGSWVDVTVTVAVTVVGGAGVGHVLTDPGSDTTTVDVTTGGAGTGVEVVNGSTDVTGKQVVVVYTSLVNHVEYLVVPPGSAIGDEVGTNEVFVIVSVVE